MRLHLLMTGDELMRGITIDGNSAAIAQKLGGNGLAITGKVTLGDDLPLLVSEIKRLSGLTDVLIINGGLGPTVDDLTAQALAEAAGVEIEEHPKAMKHLEQWCSEANMRVLNEANRKQAYLPAGSTVIPNPLGSAVGFQLELNDCLVFCTPGVPGEMKRMLDDHILPTLIERYPNASPVRQSRFHVFGLGESRLQQWVSDVFPDWPDDIELGFRAGLPTLEVKLTSVGQELDKIHDLWRGKLITEMGSWIVSEGDLRLPEAIINLLKDHHKKITTAESCTGGLIASMLTSVSGSSDVFEAGFVTYSNNMKSEMLGVQKSTLDKYGAVSEEVVRQMAAGALDRGGADLAVAVSGVAGPTGGTADKPVGTVWLAWGDADNIKAQKFFVPRRRHIFQQLVAALGLDLIRRKVLGIETDPNYFSP